MDKRLRLAMQTLQTAKQDILQRTTGLDSQHLQFQPSPHEWSIEQVFQHLILLESQVLSVVKKRVAKADLPRAGLRCHLNYALVVGFLRYRKKIKAPAVVQPPGERKNLTTLRRDWEALDEQWQQLLESLPPHRLNKEIFKHPVAGFLTLPQTIGFVREHIRHHVPQVKRLAASRPVAPI